MALLKLDEQNISLEIKVGVLESYQPDQEIQEIKAQVDNVRKEAENKLIDIVGWVRSYDGALEILEKNEPQKQEWQDYLEQVLNKKIEKIRSRIHEKNKEICPNYEDHFE